MGRLAVAAPGTADSTQTPRKQPRRWEHPHSRFNPGPEVAGGSSEQGDSGGLPETPGQVTGLLDHELGGDDAQVQSQQLIALHHLCLVVLAVITQQLPEDEKTEGLAGTAQMPFLTTLPLECPSRTQCPSTSRTTASDWGDGLVQLQ